MVEDKELIVERLNFVSSIYCLDTKINCQEALSFIKSFKDKRKTDQNTTSYFHTANILNYPELNKFKEELLQYFISLGGQFLSAKQIIIEDSWVQYYENNEFHSTHVHGTLEKNKYSFIFYLQASDQSAKTCFNGPGYPYIQSEEIKIIPKTNKLVIFDSHLPHYVESNKGEERIILSGNFIVE